MTWADLTRNWSYWFKRLKSQFPNLEDSAMPFLKQDRTRFELYLAERHQMSIEKAREELEDFLYLEALQQSQHGPTGSGK